MRRLPARPLAVAVPALAVLVALAAPAPLFAQEGGTTALPRPATGVPALVLPLQDAEPMPSGGWPGGEESRAALIERFGAEMDFAVDGRDRGPDWVPPRELRALARRNPMLAGDPDRLAAEGLPRAGEDLPAALHGQLRDLAAATGARYALLPVRMAYRRAGDPSLACPSATAEDGERAADPLAGSDPAALDSAGAEARGRPVLCVALLDVRGARVIWRGAVLGPPADADDPSIPATLAQRLLDTFSGGR